MQLRNRFGTISGSVKASSLFFTADHHFGHANVIKLCDRPFDTVEQMNEALIKSWNSVVKPDSVVFHLGDFSFKPSCFHSIVRRLNGIKYLLLGNHDPAKALLKDNFGFEDIGISAEIITSTNGESDFIVASHYPYLRWNRSHYGSWCLFGHAHGRLDPSLEKTIDVGIDNIHKLVGDFRPVSWLEIKKLRAALIGAKNA